MLSKTQKKDCRRKQEDILVKARAVYELQDSNQEPRQVPEETPES